MCREVWVPDRLLTARELIPKPIVAPVLVGEDPRWLVRSVTSSVSVSTVTSEMC